MFFSLSSFLECKTSKLCFSFHCRFSFCFAFLVSGNIATRYVASLVMEHLSGIFDVYHCKYVFLDAIEEGMNGNVIIGFPILLKSW